MMRPLTVEATQHDDSSTAMHHATHNHIAAPHSHAHAATHNMVLGEPRHLIRSLLGAALSTDDTLRIRGVAQTLDELHLMCDDHRPRLILVSAAFGHPIVFDHTRRLRAAFPDSAVVFFALDARDHFISQAMEAGASAYITAAETRESLLEALRKVAEGHAYYSPDVEERRSGRALLMVEGVAEPKVRPRLTTLTKREVEVLACIAQGLSKKQIAKHLNRSHKTVDNHSTNLMNKLDIHDRVELARFAIREGLASI